MRKKVPYEGRTRRRDKAGEKRTALLEMRTALQGTRTAKSMRVNDENNFFFLWNFVFFKMNGESEHPESKLYYPGELSDAELLQSPTRSEITEGKSTLLTNREKICIYLNRPHPQWGCSGPIIPNDETNNANEHNMVKNPN